MDNDDNLKVTNFILQDDTYKEYEVGTCEPSRCNKDRINNCDWNIHENGEHVRDWKYGEKRCNNNCMPISLCSRKKPYLCPQIDEMDFQEKWDYQRGAPNIICKYSVDIFSREENIKIYTEKWGEDENYNNIIMPKYCTSKVKTCPENYKDEIINNCSRMVSTGMDGVKCREWARQNKEISTKSIAKYCSENNTEDCGCINSESLTGDFYCDKCGHYSYLTIGDSNCDNIDKKGINLDFLALSNNYDIKSFVKPNIIKEDISNNEDNLKGYIVIIIIIIVIIVIIVAILLLFYRTRKNA